MFRKNLIYILKDHYEHSAKYCVPIHTGDYYVCDCILLNESFEQVKGYEYPVPIEFNQLGEIHNYFKDN